MMQKMMVGLVLLAALGSAAEAAPASPDEAHRLTALFERYVGHGPEGKAGPVSVVPHGEAYTATFDLSRMLGVFAGVGTEVTAGDLVAELTPQPDGRWHVSVDGFPPVGIGQGEKAFSFTVSNYAFDGLFDPALQAFASVSTRSSGSKEHVVGQDAPMDVTLTDTAHSTAMAESSGTGTINATTSSTASGVDYTIATPPPPASQGGAASGPTATATQLGKLRADQLAATTRIEHEPVIAIEDLWQFLVAHPTKPALIAVQAALKTKLRAIIPLASAFKTELTLSKASVETRLGAFGLDSFSESSSIAATDPAGSNLTTLRFAGLTMPPGLVPPWAAPLVPTSLDLTQSYGPLDLAAAASMAIDAFDLAATPPIRPDQQAAIVKALGSDQAVLTIAPSTIVTPTLSLKIQSETHFTKPLPSGSATIAATGLDKTMAALRALGPSDPMATQAITVLMAAKALGKAEGPDSYSWVIAAPFGGDLTVNGNSLGAIVRSQQMKPRKTMLQP